MVLSFGRHGWPKPDARVGAGRSEDAAATNGSSRPQRTAGFAWLSAVGRQA